MKIGHVKLGTTLAAGALFWLAAGSAQAASMPAAAQIDVARAGSTLVPVEETQFRGRGMRGGRHFGGGRYYGGRHYGGRRWGGRGVGAGVAAGVIGGLIGGALLNSRPAYGYGYGYGAPVYSPAPVYVAPGGGAVEYCMRRFRSYDPATGTYIGYDGRVRSCP